MQLWLEIDTVESRNSTVSEWLYFRHIFGFHTVIIYSFLVSSTLSCNMSGDILQRPTISIVRNHRWSYFHTPCFYAIGLIFLLLPARMYFRLQCFVQMLKSIFPIYEKDCLQASRSSDTSYAPVLKNTAHPNSLKQLIVWTNFCNWVVQMPFLQIWN